MSDRVSPPAEPGIALQSLSKAYGSIQAVADLSLRVTPGRIFALLGPNGAGKSTTISCIVGLQRPDRGSVHIDGIDALADPAAARRRLSFVPEVAHVYEALTPHEYLTLRGRLFDLDDATIRERADRLLGGFGLSDRRHQPLAGFSKGMTQKCVLAAALLTEPRVLVLDEPLSGLDVETTMLVKEVMREFARRGGTLLYSSHLLDVVETVADDVMVIRSGREIALGTVAELKARTGRGDSSLEHAFAQLTEAADPSTRARALLG